MLVSYLNKCCKEVFTSWIQILQIEETYDVQKIHWISFTESNNEISLAKDSKTKSQCTNKSLILSGICRC